MEVLTAVYFVVVIASLQDELIQLTWEERPRDDYLGKHPLPPQLYSAFR